MKFSRLILIVLAAIILNTSSFPDSLSAHAASFSPITGATFNNPTGTPDEQYAIVNQLQNSIDAAPKGSVIRMAFFSLSIQSFSDKLIAAHDRGVSVQLIMDNHDIRPQWTALQAALGTNIKSPSFAVTCTNGCLSGREGALMHAKFYLFSTAGTAKQVSVVSSANPTYSQATLGFNNAYTVVGDAALYGSYRTYFLDMAAGSQGALQPDYYRLTQSGAYTSYLFPRPGNDAKSDTIYSILSNVACSKAAAGYGANGHTVIHIAMLEWTRSRVDLAQKLWSLDDAGCEVEIITNTQNVEPEIMAALTKKGSHHGGPIVRNAAQGVYYVHDKYLLINGKYAGDSSAKIVFTGSHNFTSQGLRYNNDVLLKIRSNAAFNAYDDNFSMLRDFATSL